MFIIFSDELQYSHILCLFQGKDFVSGGLDALENLGKKTMEVLTEGDPGELSQLVRSENQGFYTFL
jgi:hypothetical protein